MGEGGFVALDVTLEFFAIAAEIGVLLLLFTLGLEYSEGELRSGLRSGLGAGVVDMALNAVPGCCAGSDRSAGSRWRRCCWAASPGSPRRGWCRRCSSDLGRLGFRETPAVLNLLVIEDLAMAVYLPVVAALIVGGSVGGHDHERRGRAAAVTVHPARRRCATGGRLSDLVAGGSDEALLLSVFGVTLLVAGMAQRLEVSGAIGAFLVGLALSGRAGGAGARHSSRRCATCSPRRSSSSSRSRSTRPISLGVAVPGARPGRASRQPRKVVTGWYAAGRIGVGRRGRLRAGTVLIARGEFSIVIAALGVSLVDGPELGALAAAYVLDHRRRRARSRRSSPTASDRRPPARAAPPGGRVDRARRRTVEATSGSRRRGASGRRRAVRRRWRRGRRRRRTGRPPTSSDGGRRAGSSGLSSSAISSTRTCSTRRPTRRSHAPAARTLRTHWVVPAGRTR